MKKVLLSLAAVAFLAVSAQAAKTVDDTMNPLITAMPSLSIAPDARSAGMGDIGVATDADLNSLHWNPAKYSYIVAVVEVGVHKTQCYRHTHVLVQLAVIRKVKRPLIGAYILQHGTIGICERYITKREIGERSRNTTGKVSEIIVTGNMRKIDVRNKFA